MADLEAIFQAVKELSPEELEKLSHFIEDIQSTEPPTKTDQSTTRVFDLHPGAIWTSDDFDDELPDEFWLGDE